MALILVLQNRSNLAPVSDYTYMVLIGDGTVERSKQIASGTIAAHVRDDGWEALVHRVITDQVQGQFCLEAPHAAI